MLDDLRRIDTFGPGPNAGPRNGDDAFWAELTPSDHFVQIYEKEQSFLDMLEAFVAGGLKAGESVIIIATPEHRAALQERLFNQDIDVEAMRAQDRFIDVDAAQTLSKFMTTMAGRPWPDEERFTQVVDGLLTRARGAGQGEHGGAHPRKVRAFGEMVALLWGRGGVGATLKLEQLWHQFCHQRAFCLFCAYPRTGFTDSADRAIREIIAAHSKCLAG